MNLAITYDPMQTMIFLGITICVIFILVLCFILWVFRAFTDDVHESNLDNVEFESCEVDAFNYLEADEDVTVNMQ